MKPLQDSSEKAVMVFQLAQKLFQINTKAKEPLIKYFDNNKNSFNVRHQDEGQI